MNIQLQKTTQKKIDLVKNLIRKVDNIIINYKPIRNLIKNPSKSPLKTHYKQPKIYYRFSRFFYIKNRTKPNRNRSVWLGFGSVSVAFFLKKKFRFGWFL